MIKVGRRTLSNDYHTGEKWPLLGRGGHFCAQSVARETVTCLRSDLQGKVLVMLTKLGIRQMALLWTVPVWCLLQGRGGERGEDISVLSQSVARETLTCVRSDLQGKVLVMLTKLRTRQMALLWTVPVWCLLQGRGGERGEDISVLSQSVARETVTCVRSDLQGKVLVVLTKVGTRQMALLWTVTQGRGGERGEDISVLSQSVAREGSGDVNKVENTTNGVVVDSPSVVSQGRGGERGEDVSVLSQSVTHLTCREGSGDVNKVENTTNGVVVDSLSVVSQGRGGERGEDVSVLSQSVTREGTGDVNKVENTTNGVVVDSPSVVSQGQGGERGEDISVLSQSVTREGSGDVNKVENTTNGVVVDSLSVVSVSECDSHLVARPGWREGGGRFCAQSVSNSEIYSVWCARVGSVSRHLPADQVQNLLNEMQLYPTQAQVCEMLQCAQDCADRSSPAHLTFGEFCLFATELKRCYHRGVPRSSHLARKLERDGKEKKKRSRKMSKSVLAKHEVFLGGSCNPTTWRHDIAIPLLKGLGITYYNPQVEDWSVELVEQEHEAKQTANVLFYVIDSQTRNVVGMIEAAAFAGARRRLVLVIKPYKPSQSIGGEVISHQEYDELSGSLLVLKSLVERQGIPVFNNIPVAVKCTAKILRDNINMQDLVSADLKQPVSNGHVQVAEKLLYVL
ncbi:hypothetical protein J6590_057758 [Homalodisca vitripennis]|nr:hypothetical protein J6590_057758 [Homalodisca vitripennis]